MKRGTFDYKVDKHEEIILCHWCDSGVFSLCSNAVGIKPVKPAGRHSGAAGVQPQVPQPWLVRLHRDKAGGVSRLDQNMARYRVKIRGLKWYSSFLGYIMDAALNNTWQLHWLCCLDAQVDLLAFRRYVAWCTWRAMRTLPRRADAADGWRPRAASTGSGPGSCTRARGPAAPMHSQTDTRCEKCQQGVRAKCFQEYHTR